MESKKELESYVPSTVNDQGVIQFTDTNHVMKVAKELIALGAVPDRFKDPKKLTGPLFFLAQTGRPYSFLRLICDIHGTMTIFAEGLPALCQRDPNYGDVEEFWVDDQGKRLSSECPKAVPFMAICRLKRKGSEIWNEYTFSHSDAMGAGLFKNKVWKDYTKDMLMHKARARAYKAMYPSTLLGLDVYEDRIDYEIKDVSPGLEALRNIGKETNEECLAKNEEP